MKLSKETRGGELLFELLKYTLETNQQQLQKCSTFLTAQQQRKEYRTIRINLGRQVGHTFAAKKLFKEYKNILIIANNAEAASTTKNELGWQSVAKTVEGKDYINTHIMSENQIIKAETTMPLWNTINIDGTKNVPDIVILDTASYSRLSESILWEIFPEMQFLILLG